MVVIDYATRYPEAMLLCDAKATMVAQELATLFTRDGFPKQILTDQGTVLMGKTLRALWHLAGIQLLKTSVYHAQTNGLVEHFNGTLKCMLRKFVQESGWDWHQWLLFLLFAMHKIPQASLGFSPFKLLYERHPWGVLDLVREK